MRPKGCWCEDGCTGVIFVDIGFKMGQSCLRHVHSLCHQSDNLRFSSFLVTICVLWDNPDSQEDSI